MNLLSRLRMRIGDFWWHSLLIFLACRSGDAIQAFIGLWLVPRYVPQSELGATLPILQMASAVGLPLAIFVIPFSRWLTIFSVRNEFGKVKRLMQIAFYGSGLVCVVMLLALRYVVPFFFERLRVAEGALGFLILCVGISTPFSTVFSNALQGMKRFKALTIVTTIGAPIRLAVLLVAMPFRALSGYLLGQLAAPVTTIGVSWFALRKELGRGVTAVPLGRADICAMLRYSVPVAINLTVVSLMGAWQMLLIRQRLTEFDSAAFYMISRLAEVATFVGLSLVTVVFPYVAEAKVKGIESERLLWKLLGGTFLAGLAVTAIYAIFGRGILSLVPLWSEYASCWPLLALYTLRQTLSITTSAFLSYETSAGRFSFLWYYVPYLLLETGWLVVCTGYAAFHGILPESAVSWLESLHVARLEYFVWWLLACSSTLTLLIGGHLLVRMRKPSHRTDN